MRREYVARQVGTDWTAAGTFDRGLGGFCAFKQENARVRRGGGDPLADVLARVEALESEPLARLRVSG